MDQSEPNNENRAIAPKGNPWWVVAIVWALRVVVGGTFVVSGFAKEIDPWGFIYKIEQYLAVWGMDVPRTVTLVGAITIAGFELLMGVSLLLGCFRRGAVWLSTLFMVAMTSLTLYIVIADPVSDCGCFGDFIVLSNEATFAKNIILLAALVALIAFNTRVGGVFHASCQWVVATFTCAYAILIGVIGYNLQPLIDFRPYPVGSKIAASNEDDDEEVALRFIYEKDGERKVFTEDALPDSTWTFVDREELTDERHKGELAIYDGDEDVTSEALSAEGPQILLLIPDFRRADIAYTYLINELNSSLTAAGGSMVALASASSEGIEAWSDLSMAQYPVYNVDDTVIKELGRGNIAVLYLSDGIIKWKRNIWSLDGFDPNAPDIIAELDAWDFDGPRQLRRWTFMYLIGISLLWLLQTFFRTTYRLIFRVR